MKMKFAAMAVPLALLVCVASESKATTLTGSASAYFNNISINFSQPDQVAVTKKGAYPIGSMFTTIATTSANDLTTSNQNSTISGIASSTAGSAYSLAEVSYTDIAPLTLSNNIYNGVVYTAYAYGQAAPGTGVGSYARVADYWRFYVTAPITVTFSFDYLLSASGNVMTSNGNALPEAYVGASLWRNINGSAPEVQQAPALVINSGIQAGSVSLTMDYLAGDVGNLSFYGIADVFAAQSDPNNPVVPEPSTVILILCGLVGIGAFVRTGAARPTSTGKGTS